MILVWGSLQDPPVALVVDELAKLGAPVILAEPHEFLHVELQTHKGVAGFLSTPRASVDLDRITAAYLRPNGSVAGPDQRGREMTDRNLLLWAELTSAFIINHPSSMAGNNTKPLQAMQLHRIGFAVPATLVTTDPDRVRQFWRQHGQVVYKSISGTRSIVRRLTPADEDRLADVRWCPTQFQQYVPGVEYRVHVVGSELFTCRIECAADDYRYATDHQRPTLSEASLPDSINERSRLASRHLGLPLVGLDLRRTPDGDWYCLEANPSPAFSYYEGHIGQPIAAAIARLLTHGDISR